jgi:hypothetical protein
MYLRALPSKWKTQLENPKLVKKLIHYLMRSLDIDDPDTKYSKENPERERVAFIWNGMIGSMNCLLDTPAPVTFNNRVLECPPIPDKLEDLVIPDSPACQINKRDGGGSCQPRTPGDGSDAITFRTGQPSPTPCSNNCGSLCTGYWCSPDPFGIQPGFLDPDNTANKPATPVSLPMPSGSSGGGGAGCPQTAVSQCNSKGSCTTIMQCVGTPQPTPKPTVPFDTPVGTISPSPTKSTVPFDTPVATISPSPTKPTAPIDTPVATISLCVGIAYKDILAAGGRGSVEYQGFGVVGTDGSNPKYDAGSINNMHASDLCGKNVNGQVVNCNGDVSRTCSGYGVASYNGLNCRTVCNGDPSPCWRQGAGSQYAGINGVIICDRRL